MLGSKNSKLINWPNSNEQVVLKILSVQDEQDAKFCTDLLFKQSKIDVTFVNSDEYASETFTQILYRALRDPKDMSKPICESISKFKMLLTNELKLYLFDEYQSFARECSPSPDNMTDDEFDRILQSVKKNPSLIYSENYSLNMLKKLIHFMVSLPENAQKHS